MRFILLAFALLVAAPAAAQDFPKLTGQVVDNADLLAPADEAALTQKLAGLATKSSRQIVVATVPDLQGYPVEDYANGLFRSWQIGQKGSNNGLLLLVSKGDRKVRVEVGYGLEPVVTDALSGEIIRDRITPAFKQGDYAGGINGGVDALIAQLQAPPDEAEQKVVAAEQRQQQSRSSGGGGSPMPLIFWGMVLAFVVLPMLRRRGRGRRYRRGGMPVILWGPGLGGGGWGGGGGGGWGGGGGGGGGWGGGGGGGFGGFSGGGGSSGGGGASGSW